jgi:hypothetical protein
MVRANRQHQQFAVVAVLDDHRLDDHPDHAEQPLPYAWSTHAVSS